MKEEKTILITDPMHIGVVLVRDKPEYHMTLRERIEAQKREQEET